MILCHKDGGVLHSDSDAESEGLYGCGCISGWVRGFEPHLDRAAAIAAQIDATRDWIKLYVGQKRDDWEVQPLRERLTKLELLS